MANPLQRVIDWQPVRDAFVRRSPRPTYAELSAEFGIPLSSIGGCAGEEAWASLRAQHLEQRLKEADASAIILEAVKIDRTLLRSLGDLALIALSRVRHEVERLSDERAPASNVEVLNTAGFAACNFARALKECGVVGIPKGLADGAQKENGRWNPEMLQQINVTVQNLQAAQSAGKPPDEPPDEPPAPSCVAVPVGPGPRPQNGAAQCPI